MNSVAALLGLDLLAQAALLDLTMDARKLQRYRMLAVVGTSVLGTKQKPGLEAFLAQCRVWPSLQYFQARWVQVGHSHLPASEERSIKSASCASSS